MPTWVPDWTFPQPTLTPKLHHKGQLPQWTYSIPNRKPIRVVDGALQVQAHVLDRVQIVSGIYTNENRFRLLLEQWQYLPNVEGQSMDTKVESFWRTLVMNMGEAKETFGDDAPPSKVCGIRVPKMKLDKMGKPIHNRVVTALPSSKHLF